MRFLAKGDASLTWYMRDRMASVTLPYGTCRIEMKIVGQNGLTFFDVTPFKSKSHHQPWIQDNRGNPVLIEAQRIQADDLAIYQLANPALNINNPWQCGQVHCPPGHYDSLLAPSAFRPASQQYVQQPGPVQPSAPTLSPVPVWNGGRPGMPAITTVPSTQPIRPCYPLPKTYAISPPTPNRDPRLMPRDSSTPIKREFHSSPTLIDLANILDTVPKESPLMSEMIEKIEDEPPAKRCKLDSPESPDSSVLSVDSPQYQPSQDVSSPTIREYLPDGLSPINI